MSFSEELSAGGTALQGVAKAKGDNKMADIGGLVVSGVAAIGSYGTDIYADIAFILGLIKVFGGAFSGHSSIYYYNDHLNRIQGSFRDKNNNTTFADLSAQKNGASFEAKKLIAQATEPIESIEWGEFLYYLPFVALPYDCTIKGVKYTLPGDPDLAKFVASYYIQNKFSTVKSNTWKVQLDWQIQDSEPLILQTDYYKSVYAKNQPLLDALKPKTIVDNIQSSLSTGVDKLTTTNAGISGLIFALFFLPAGLMFIFGGKKSMQKTLQAKRKK